MSPGELTVIGLSHRTARADLRDRIFIADAELDAVRGRLADAGIANAVVLSTCDRIEIEAALDDPAQADVIEGLLRARAGDMAVNVGEIYRLRGPEALRHVFALAASLESQVIGEPQVLGQVHAARERFKPTGILDYALQAAFVAAKRVRSETAIGERPVSLAAAVAELVRDVHGEVARVSALLVGAGEMGETLVQHLRERGLKRVTVAAPNAARADEVARRVGGHVIGYGDLASALAHDLIVTAVGAGRHAITAATLDAALRVRRRRPVLVVDLGIPPDVDPAVEALDGAFRYDLDDLERAIIAGKGARADEAARAWAIVDEEVARFARARAERGAVPAIQQLRAHVEGLRAAALREAGGDAARATELLMNRLLHEPSERLRRLVANDPARAAEIESLLRELFGEPR